MRAAELVVANIELAFESEEKADRAAEHAAELVAAYADIDHFALHDQLTNLPNRRLLLDRLQHAQIASKRNKQRGALLFFDLDRFKALNDSHGHAFGDLLLQEVARRLKSCIRNGDTASRIGGDEFVVLLEGLGEDITEAVARVTDVAKKIIAILDKPYQLNEVHWKCSASLGVTLFINDEIVALELLRQADVAMYQAKSSGGNGMRFYDSVIKKAP